MSFEVTAAQLRRQLNACCLERDAARLDLKEAYEQIEVLLEENARLRMLREDGSNEPE